MIADRILTEEQLVQQATTGKQGTENKQNKGQTTVSALARETDNWGRTTSPAPLNATQRPDCPR